MVSYQYLRDEAPAAVAPALTTSFDHWNKHYNLQQRDNIMMMDYFDKLLQVT